MQVLRVRTPARRARQPAAHTTDAAGRVAGGGDQRTGFLGAVHHRDQQRGGAQLGGVGISQAQPQADLRTGLCQGLLEGLHGRRHPLNLTVVCWPPAPAGDPDVECIAQVWRRWHGQAVMRLQGRCAGGLYTPVDASPG
jgi:hypothetical protein